jgi:hypothetical protein
MQSCFDEKQLFLQNKKNLIILKNPYYAGILLLFSRSAKNLRFI